MIVPPHLDDSAAARLSAINAGGDGRLRSLRIGVRGGGCSGFEYEISLSDGPSGDDIVVEKNGQYLVVDPVSAPFLEDAVVRYEEKLIGSAFVVENPNTVSQCGCGTSFAI